MIGYKEIKEGINTAGDLSKEIEDDKTRRAICTLTAVLRSLTNRLEAIEKKIK